MDCSLPGSSIHGILQARILECVAIPFSRESSQPRNRTWVSFTAGRFFTIWAIGKPLYVIYIFFFMIIKNVSEGWINLWVFANLSGVAAWNAVSYYNCLCHEDIPEASRISVANTHRLKPSFQSFVCMNVFIQIYWYTWVYIHILLLLFSLLNHVQLSATPWTVACQAPLSMGFSRQEYWSGLPLPSPGDLLIHTYFNLN